jgi:hypothetical protein
MLVRRIFFEDKLISAVCADQRELTHHFYEKYENVIDKIRYTMRIERELDLTAELHFKSMNLIFRYIFLK